MLNDANSDLYAAATRPHNSSVAQRPARVAIVSGPDDIAPALDEVAALATSSGTPLEVVPQATGHGAGAPVAEDAVLLDTSRLTSVSIDAESRVAVVGAGATWAAVNAAAEKHGLLGLAGSAPSVSVSGYTFGGGIGWLVRRDGLASGALRAVHYVDGSGRSRTAADDAADDVDREAMWAFRGAGGVGIAHTLELELVPAPDLHAGALLWHADALPELTAAWSRTIGTLGGGSSPSPPGPPRRGRAPSGRWVAASPPASRCSTCHHCPSSRRSCRGRSPSTSRSPIRAAPSRRLRCWTRCAERRRPSPTAGARPTRRDSPGSTWTRRRRPRPSGTRGGSTRRPRTSSGSSSRLPRGTMQRS